MDPKQREQLLKFYEESTENSKKQGKQKHENMTLDLGVSHHHERVALHFSNQHTLCWYGSIEAEISKLPKPLQDEYHKQMETSSGEPVRIAKLTPGARPDDITSCNLYKFPTLAYRTRSKTKEGPRNVQVLRHASAEEVVVLQAILLAMTRQSVSRESSRKSPARSSKLARGQQVSAREQQENDTLPEVRAQLAERGEDDVLQDRAKEMGWLGNPDSSGARPIHALLISNHPTALAVVREMFNEQPVQMLLRHGPLTCEGTISPFVGESSLHIAIVNGNEELACYMLDLASEAQEIEDEEEEVEASPAPAPATSPAPARASARSTKSIERMNRVDRGLLIHAMVRGSFFEQQQGNIGFYGGSPLAFAAVAGLKRVVDKILQMERSYDLRIRPRNEHRAAAAVQWHWKQWKQQKLNVHDPSKRLSKANSALIATLHEKSEKAVPEENAAGLNGTRCLLTGFLPLHALVAAAPETDGMHYDMIEYLVDKVAPGQRANLQYAVVRPSHREQPVTGATSIAFRAACDDLYGLNPLQLAVKLGKPGMYKRLLRKQTTRLWDWGPLRCYEIRLDGIADLKDPTNVMNLVCRFDARKATQELLLDTCMKGLLFSLFQKQRRKLMHFVHASVVLEFIHLVLILVIIMRQHAKGGIADDGVLRVVGVFLVVCIGLQSIEEVLVARGWWKCMTKNRTVPQSWRRQSWRRLVQWQHQNMFEYHVASLTSSLLCAIRLIAQEKLDGIDGMLQILLSISFLSQCVEVVRNIASPFPQYIYFLIIMHIVTSDVFKFLGFAISIFFSLWGAMFAVYPRNSGVGEGTFEGNDWLDESPKGTIYSIADSMFYLFQLFTTGEQLALDFEPVHSEQVQGWDLANFIFFMTYYFIFVVLMAIICINLLIAMMSETYAKMVAKAQLEWRVDFARRVLRLELLEAGFNFGCTFKGKGATPVPGSVDSGRQTRTSGRTSNGRRGSVESAVEHFSQQWPEMVPQQNATTLVDEREDYVHKQTAEIDPETGTDRSFFGFNSWYDKVKEQEQTVVQREMAGVQQELARLTRRLDGTGPPPPGTVGWDPETNPKIGPTVRVATAPTQMRKKPSPSKTPSLEEGGRRTVLRHGSSAWVQKLDHESGHYYWQNQQTGERSLTLPGSEVMPSPQSLPGPTSTWNKAAIQPDPLVA